ncbi:MAG: crossover junction endodeoxyribonuclease RuvC [Candidatus Latescibacteria bacterium]|nr:crossover junction endodeoxyribonuclease RuvC [Candidatus Latescibacterota bacterium]
MIILGIDPGSVVTGYGVISQERRQMRLVECGCIKMKAGSPLPGRLKRIYDGLCEVLERCRPEQVAIESTFSGKNPRSALTLGHARGVAVLAAANAELPIMEYAPREIKMSVVGTGGASKEQIQSMVQALLQLPRPPKPADAADAVAIAICHANRNKWKP